MCVFVCVCVFVLLVCLCMCFLFVFFVVVLFLFLFLLLLLLLLFLFAFSFAFAFAFAFVFAFAFAFVFCFFAFCFLFFVFCFVFDNSSTDDNLFFLHASAKPNSHCHACTGVYNYTSNESGRVSPFVCPCISKMSVNYLSAACVSSPWRAGHLLSSSTLAAESAHIYLDSLAPRLAI